MRLSPDEENTSPMSKPAAAGFFIALNLKVDKLTHMTATLKNILADENLQMLISSAREQSVSLYLVGGSVRDALLGRELNDFDFALSAAWEEVARRFARKIGGSFFWLDEPRQQARVVKKLAQRSLTFDFAPLRGTSIEEDVQQRDFTINALACRLGGSGFQVVDPLDGIACLEKGVVKICSPASFRDDPLRLLRAVRFSATLDFAIDADTWNTLCGQSHLLGRVAGERLRDEFFQILDAPHLERSLGLLLDSGLLTQLVPFSVLNGGIPSSDDELHHAMQKRIKSAALIEATTDRLKEYFPEEHEQFSEHLHREVEAGITVLSLVKLAAFADHDVMPGMLDVIGKRLRLGNRSMQMLQQLIRKSHRLAAMSVHTLSIRSKYRLFKDAEPAGLALIILALVEGKATPDLCRQLIHYFYAGYQPDAPDLLLSGSEVMALLQLQPGAAVGMALKRLREAETIGIVNTKAEAEAFLEKNLLTNKESIG